MVINHNDLNGSVSLSEARLDSSADGAFSIEHRYDDGDLHGDVIISKYTFCVLALE